MGGSGRIAPEPPSDGGPKSNAFYEVFDAAFPYYLSIGMTADEFWNQDPWLLGAYVKAHQLKMEQQNQMLWLQGLYVYQGIMAVSPILHAFAKRGTRPRPYLDAPIPLTSQAQRSQDDQKAQAQLEQAKAHMQRMTALTAHISRPAPDGRDELERDNDREFIS